MEITANSFPAELSLCEIWDIFTRAKFPLRL